ncbi:hypothetical protein B0T10DRAFT_485984 [Thelonectria olida]|uniref:Uncharacterized protein n=1 Tax=Thelonectria olida TaxID=1576542 RepID=A0A9P8W7W3_9HYPO|nr:hypothetical protein B0T10DRAFT_485984 [Thelonectria olida]
MMTISKVLSLSALYSQLLLAASILISIGEPHSPAFLLFANDLEIVLSYFLSLEHERQVKTSYLSCRVLDTFCQLSRHLSYPSSLGTPLRQLNWTRNSCHEILGEYLSGLSTSADANRTTSPLLGSVTLSAILETPYCVFSFSFASFFPLFFLLFFDSSSVSFETTCRLEWELSSWIPIPQENALKSG